MRQEVWKYSSSYGIRRIARGNKLKQLYQMQNLNSYTIHYKYVTVDSGIILVLNPNKIATQTNFLNVSYKCP